MATSTMPRLWGKCKGVAETLPPVDKALAPFKDPRPVHTNRTVNKHVNCFAFNAFMRDIQPSAQLSERLLPL